MLAMALVVMLAQVDAPVPPDAPVSEPAQPERASFVNPERAKLDYEIAQLKRDRPNLGFSVTMMVAGTVTFAVALLVGLVPVFVFAVVSTVGAVAGAVVAVVGVVTLITGATRIGAVDKQIAEKKAALRALEALPQPGVLAPAPAM